MNPIPQYDDALQAELLSKLSLSPQQINLQLLGQALTHKSVMVDKNTQHLPHNERLEFLGDAFIKSSISEWLFWHLPDAAEGRMSQIRSYVVSDAALSKVAYRLDLGKYIILGDSERSSGELRESILANVFESLCGVLFLSTEFRTTARIILELLKPELKLALLGQDEEVLNYKAMLQEYTQAQSKTLPDYEVLSSEGPDHELIFSIQVSLQERILGTGSGRSKKRAEQDAAREALMCLNVLSEDGTVQAELIPEPAELFLDSPFALQPPESVMQTTGAFESRTLKEKRLLLAPSILSANFAHLGLALQQIDDCGAEWVHLDVMDGHFVPNLTIGPPVIASLRPLSQKVFDAHLMMSYPERFIEDFVKAGCERITVHYEASTHLDRVISQIQEAGALPGVSLNPHTPVSVLEDVLYKLHLVLIMSVNPGFGGQKFIPQALKRIRQVADMRQALNLDHPVLIQVDGGINQETLPQVIDAGADVVVIGSAIFGQEDIVAAMGAFQQQLYTLSEGH